MRQNSQKPNLRGISRRDFLRLTASGLAAMAGAGAAGLLTGCKPAQPSAVDLALVNGTLIDGTGADPVSDAVVTVQGKRITAVGARSRVTIPAGAQTVDVQGATVLPGFINTHVHSAYDEDTLKAWAQGGVTTVRDLGNGGSREGLFAFRDEVRGEPECARLVAVGPMVTVPDGYPIAPWGGQALTVDSPEDARQKVARLIEDGAEVVKIAIDSGVIFQRRIPILSPETAAAIVEVAHEKGIPVSAHVTVAEDLERALDAGVDDIAHMVVDNLPGELIHRMVETDVYWVPTLELWQGVSRVNPVNFITKATENLGRFVEAGGKVALGTDYAGYQTEFDLGTPVHEVDGMLEAGMTPLQIIVAATKYAAHVCNLASEIGTLEVGKVADLLVVDGDPLQDIRALTETRMVIHGGVVVRG